MRHFNNNLIKSILLTVGFILLAHAVVHIHSNESLKNIHEVSHVECESICYNSIECNSCHNDTKSNCTAGNIINIFSLSMIFVVFVMAVIATIMFRKLCSLIKVKYLLARNHIPLNDWYLTTFYSFRAPPHLSI